MKSIEEAVQAFKRLDISGRELKAGDDFFGEHGMGVDAKNVSQPYERFCHYEKLLHALYNEDPCKFQQIHKGTAYYFMFWNAFDCRLYDKALFYIDAAISENFQWRGMERWKGTQSASFLFLKEPSKDHGGKRVIRHTKELLTREIDRFNALSQEKLDPQTFPKQFVEALMEKKDSHRSVITAFYTWLLESDERLQELKIRSVYGGSIELPIVFLFKGGLIFESLLKTKYQGRSLEAIFKNREFRAKFPVGLSTSAESLRDIIDQHEQSAALHPDDVKAIRSAFSITSQLRNTAGHNLARDDVFKEPKRFRIFFEQEVNAMLFFLAKTLV